MNINEVKDRISKPTPPFFRQLRTIGLALAGVGAAILAAPVSLPAVLVTAAGYLVTGGAVLSAVSQATVKDE
jgi:ABC-type xylose transport system permease subunit